MAVGGTGLGEAPRYLFELRVTVISDRFGPPVVVNESSVVQFGECSVVEPDCNLRLVCVVTSGERNCKVIDGGVVFGRIFEVLDDKTRVPIGEREEERISSGNHWRGVGFREHGVLNSEETAPREISFWLYNFLL
ncbi:hypothetical protein ACFQS4_07860 [Saliphagus sp. GCM10025317]